MEETNVAAGNSGDLIDGAENTVAGGREETSDGWTDEGDRHHGGLRESLECGGDAVRERQTRSVGTRYLHLEVDHSVDGIRADSVDADFGGSDADGVDA